MKRSTRKSEPICTWCKQTLPPQQNRDPNRPVTLKDGTPWRVCGPDCPDRPDGAPIGRMP